MISLRRYRRAAVPLLAIQTADPAEIVKLALSEAVGKDTTYPVLTWDCMHGIRPANSEARSLAVVLNDGGVGVKSDPVIATGNPAEALRALERLKEIECAPIIVALGMADVLEDKSAGIVVRQGLWNLRDILSVQGAILVLTVPLGWQNPFPNDIAVAVSPLPDGDELADTVARIAKAAGLEEPSESETLAACDALTGLSTFAAEQALAMSVTKEGLDIESLWARKRQQISETPGLSVYAGKETFDDLGGLEQAKNLFTAMMEGRRKPGAIIFVDEIEKALAGTQGDTSGVAADQLGCLLSYMQDNDASGSIFVGPPGAAKSALAKAIGNEGGIPTVTLDMGGLKGSLVGQSETRMRTALAVITAISGGRPFFVATCNSIATLPPELRRRFTVGTMFFDLPTAEERDIIWPIYLKKFGLKKQRLPVGEGWTGAEIRQCADMADRLDMTLLEASKFVVPVSVSARERIDALRREADGRYLSASSAGLFKYKPVNTATGRKINLD